MHSHQIRFRYLKEYTCFQMKQRFNNSRIPSQLCKLKFTGASPRYRGEPKIRTQAIDKTIDYEKLYVFKWQFNQVVTLDLFIFNEQKFIRFEMSDKPLLINISAGYLYVIGGNHIYIIQLSNVQNCMEYVIADDDLYSLKPAYIQNQFGMILYSWNKNQGFKSRKFSHSYVQQESNWVSKLASNLFLRKGLAQTQIYGSLKIIIPNILGLVLLSDTSYCFISLTTMEVLLSTKTKLTGWSIQKPNKVSVKYHQNIRSHSFDDSLLIAIAQRNYIQIVTVHFKYDADKKMQHNIDDEKIPIVSTLTNGYLIDWQSITVIQYVCLYIDGPILDYVMLDDGIIYYCQQSSSNKIPASNFVHYLNPLVKYPILALQHNIWGQHIIDSRIHKNNPDHEISLNRYLIPNRYSIPFLLESTGMYPFQQIQAQEINRKKLIIDWTNSYKINRLLIFKSDIIVVRQSSISTFLQITQDQFLSEYRDTSYSKNQLHAMLSNQGMSNSMLSVDSDNYQHPEQSSVPQHAYQFTYERCLSDNIKSQQFKQTQNPFANFMRQFERKLLNPNEALSVYGALQNKSNIFARELLLNRLKDMVLFYTAILTDNFVGCKNTDISPSQSIDIRICKQEELLIHYLNQFSKIINEPAEQINNYGIDLFQSFINSKHKLNIMIDENDQEIVNIDKECWLILSKLFEDLLPGLSASNTHTKNGNINSFVKLLVKNSTVYKNQSEKYLLFNMFSFIFTLNPQNIFISGSIFYALHYMPIESGLFNRIYNSYLLKIMNEIRQGQYLTEQEGIKNFLSNLDRNCILSKKQRESIRHTLGQFLEYSTSTQSQKPLPRYLTNVETGPSVSDQEIMDTNTMSVKKLVTSLNLIDMDITENYLKKITDQQQLYQFFRTNLETDMVLTREKSSNISHNYLQQLLCGWILFYRIFVWKYNMLILDVNESEKIKKNPHQIEQQNFIKLSSREQKNKRSKLVLQKKSKALEYIKNCIKAFENAGYYYQKLSGNKLTNQEMVAWTGQYLVYGRLATSSWLTIIQFALSDQYFQNYGHISTICQFHLCYLFGTEITDQAQKLNKLKQLHKYFSKSAMSKIVTSNSTLRRQYIKLSAKIKAFFGYTEINTVSMHRSKQFVTQMQFRNAYVQAQFGKVM